MLAEKWKSTRRSRKMVLWSLVILVAYTSVASFLSSFSAEPATSIVPGTNNKRSLLEVLPEAGADPHEIILSSPKYKMPSKSSRRKKFSVIGTVFKTVYNNAVVPFLDVTDLELDAPSPAPPLTVKDEDVRPQNPFDTSLGGDDDDGEDECSSIGTRTGSKCQFVKDHCGDVATLFNYLEFHYCTMDSAPVVSLILLAFAVLYWISLLTSTADDYFVVQLHVLSEKLALSDEVAGITLLALGNGAPDVFTSISGIGSGDFDIVIGELLGASVFISTVILGTVILCADVEVDRSSFLRDILVYIIASVGIMLTVMDGSINLFESLMFLVLYVMYVFVVLVGSWWTRKQQEAVREAEKANNIYHELPNAASEDPNAHMYTRSSSHFDPTMDNPHVQSDIQFLTDDERGEAALAGLTWDGSAHPVSKLIVVLEYPFSLLRWLSIPSATADWDAKRRFLAACSPACAGAVIALDVKGWDAFASVSSTDWALAASAALLSFLAIYFTSNNHSRPPYHFLLVVLAFVSTVGWLNLLANECVSVAQSLGLINNISSSIMGLTILAWGNSVGDWVADVAVAKAGNTKMAVATCFGSPLLNDIVGLGLALTMTCLNTEKSVQTPLDDKVKLGYTFLFISLFSSVSCFSCSSYRPPKSFALYLIVLYVVFLVLSILEATGSISLPF